MKYYKMAGIIIFVVMNMWITMTFLRTHYIIDFTSGYVFGRFVHRIGEKISYYPDVKLLGYNRQKRYSHHYDPCPRCGWGNPMVLQRKTVKAEIDLQKRVAVEQLDPRLLHDLRTKLNQKKNNDNNDVGGDIEMAGKIN